MAVEKGDEANVKSAHGEKRGEANRLLGEAARAAQGGRLPPVHLWNPPYCGEIDMRIRRDGTWFYEGTPIGRPALVRLFASILKREGDRYFLVTPVEKVGIVVEDVPFIAVDVDCERDEGARVLIFETNVGERVPLDDEHPLRVEIDPQTGTPKPYLHVRAGLEARLDRKTFYRLVDLGEIATVEGVEWFGVCSKGRFWPIIRAAALELAADAAAAPEPADSRRERLG